MCRNRKKKHHINRSDLIRVGMAFWLAAVLFGCTTTPPAPIVTPDSNISAAQAAAAESDWNTAAQRWSAAATANPGDASSYWLNAAEAFWFADDAMGTRETLPRVNRQELSRQEVAREALLRGEMALALRDLEEAEFYLDAAADGLPGAQRARLDDAVLQVEALRRDPAAAALAEASAMVERSTRVDALVALRVLEILESIPSDRLALEAEKPTRLGQWSALALHVRNTLVERKDLLEAAQEWQALNPLHPVDERTYLEVAWQYGRRFTPPERIAVILPTSGALASAGAAIRDGLVSAYLDQPAASQLEFFGIDDDPQSAVEAVRQAQASGMDFVIGPLNRRAVQAVASEPGLNIPMLLLNRPQIADPESPFAFSSNEPPRDEQEKLSLALSLEAEAEAVAKKMIDAGHSSVIVLLAESEWARRSEEAFQAAFQNQGGEVISTGRFAASNADHSATLTQLLQIEDSRQRKQRLQGLLNIPLEFEDSRRDDFEAFFMAAEPVLGRQLKPQLRFFDAGGKPVYAMGRVFSGKADAGADVDLNGVVIPTTRWSLDYVAEDSAPFASTLGGAFSPLLALGRDAWNVLPWLTLMRQDVAFQFPGDSGNLSLADDGNLEREPVWAIFQRGRPVALTETSER